MSSKVSYFSFEEFENKIVGFWHWKRPLSIDMGSLGLEWTELWLRSPAWGWHTRLLYVVSVLWLTPTQSCKDAVETDAEPGTTPMRSALMPLPPTLRDFTYYTKAFPPCQYATLKNNCFLFLLMAVTTHCCFFLWFYFIIKQLSKEYRHWFASC